MLNPELSVIICTFNTQEVTLRCLDKLKRSIDFAKVPVEVIVVENGTDGTGSVIKQKYPWVGLLEPGENTGFARGNNLGLNAANKQSNYFLLLNSDVLVNQETIRKSIDFMQSHPSCDAMGCKLLFEDGKFQPSGGAFPRPLSVITWILGIDLIPVMKNLITSFHEKDMSFFASDRKMDWVMGAYLFMKNDVFLKTKGFDESLFMYMEEVELCKRIKDAGLTLWYTPSFSVTHLDKTSSKQNPEKLRNITQQEILGVIYFLKKYYANQFGLTLAVIKLGIKLRVLGFSLLGDNTRKLAYQETLESIK